jgi:hypothetical protein
MDGFFHQLLQTLAAAGLQAGVSLPAWLTTQRLVLLGIPLVVAAAVVLLDLCDRRAERRARAAAQRTLPKPHWAVSLLVDADEGSGTLRPIVQLAGPPVPADVTVHLHVTGANGDVDLAGERRFSGAARRTDLVLGTLSAPAGVSVERVALCDWTVTVTDDGREIARRRGPLAAAGRLNDEGELQAPDLEPVPDENGPPTLRPSPVRSLRRTLGLAGSAAGISAGAYLLTTFSAWLWILATPAYLLAFVLVVAAGCLLHTTCPSCGGYTTVMGRTGSQQCDLCGTAFDSLFGRKPRSGSRPV